MCQRHSAQRIANNICNKQMTTVFLARRRPSDSRPRHCYGRPIISSDITPLARCSQCVAQFLARHTRHYRLCYEFMINKLVLKFFMKILFCDSLNLANFVFLFVIFRVTAISICRRCCHKRASYAIARVSCSSERR